MGHPIRFSEAVNIGLHAMVYLAGERAGRTACKDLSEILHVSENHLSKVLQRLHKTGLLLSTRGPKGGFVLARDAARISLLEVYEAIEGPLEQKKCLFEKPVCTGPCILGGLLENIGTELRRYLSNNTLADFSGRIQGGEHACA